MARKRKKTASRARASKASAKAKKEEDYKQGKLRSQLLDLADKFATAESIVLLDESNNPSGKPMSAEKIKSAAAAFKAAAGFMSCRQFVLGIRITKS